MDSNQGKPKYYILMEDLKEAIRSGKIKPGDKLLSENQLTVKYGVSRHTVRKALSMLQNDGYIVVEHGRGSFCADTVFTRGSSKNIAVITTYISNYIFPLLIKGIDNVLTEQGYSIILKNTKNSRAIEMACLEDVLKKNVDGVIIEPSKSQIYSRHLEIYKKFDECNIPCVFIHGTYPQFKDKPSIVMDDEKGMYLITKYLIDLGHKNLVGIFKTDDNQGFRRHIGFVKALNECGIMYNPEMVIWYHTEDKLLKPRAEMIEMIRNGVRFDAVVCYNDQLAHIMINTLREIGLSVPRDVSVTGFDNSYSTEIGVLGVTTVEHPKERLGAMAAELLLERINGVSEENSRVPRVIEPQLIIKDSCIAR
ncbi:GntR family transcriptional regulator [Anaeromicropila populeti]|uniref:GntR family transcriptional regulator, arabinose operon transcriptional repressor n=1 Tax=Anaeromicropila populeti TaxID=37658 RepID=A0A1I6L629_9FIRM|nr:GntR family transcriptional regulator [Anaeromicropila populeti]SFR98897.1 GntR family transcriptional regulator, arabinose operon transcriptional repressor [Anaeromicropila populeti]